MTEEKSGKVGRAGGGGKRVRRATARSERD